MSDTNVYQIVDELGPKSTLFKAIGEELTRLKTENEQLQADDISSMLALTEVYEQLLLLQAGGVA